jgi:hypothetical protein
VEFHHCRDRDDFLALQGSSRFRDCYLLEHHIAAQHRDGRPFALPGVCRVDAAAVDFEVDPLVSQPPGIDLANPPAPNWRETLSCPRCRLNNRHRAIAATLLEAADAVRAPGRVPSVYLMEQVTAAYALLAGLGDRLACVGSEFLGPEVAPGELRGGIRHEDAERLSFPDACFDFVVSNDVLEHVADPLAAAREIARVLRPGGELFLAIPFDVHKKETTCRARRSGVGIEHLLPATYHGNPVKPEEGSLVFTDFGWDFVAQLESIGLRDCAAWVYWSLEYGHLGGTQFFFRALRDGAA